MLSTDNVFSIRNVILPYYVEEEEQIFVRRPSNDSCGLFLAGTKVGNERNDAIRQFMLSYRAFKHTNVSAIKEAFSHPKLQHLILFALLACPRTKRYWPSCTIYSFS